MTHIKALQNVSSEFGEHLVGRETRVAQWRTSASDVDRAAAASRVHAQGEGI